LEGDLFLSFAADRAVLVGLMPNVDALLAEALAAGSALHGVLDNIGADLAREEFFGLLNLPIAIRY